MIQLEPLGVLRTAFTQPEGTPIQPGQVAGQRGHAEIQPAFVPGLKWVVGRSGFSLTIAAADPVRRTQTWIVGGRGPVPVPNGHASGRAPASG